MITDTDAELLQFFKALADETRLKIVGLLAQESRTSQQLAASLDLKPAAIARHLAKLTEAGLVSLVTEDASTRYRLRLDAIHALAGQVLARPPGPQVPEDLDAYDRKVLTDFLQPDGSLREVPAQERKLLAVLRHILQAFEPGCEYSEKQVNAIIAHFHADTASLRRAMIDYGMMARSPEGSRYWRPAGA